MSLSRSKRWIDLNNISIKQKIILIIMIITSISLIIASSTFLIYDTISFKKKTANDLLVKANAVAYLSNAALSFRHRQGAEKNLSSFKVDKNIIGAVIYTEDSTIFAIYLKDSIDYDLKIPSPQKALSEKGYKYEGNHLNLYADIIDEDNPDIAIGKLFVCADLQEYYKRLTNYIIIIGITLAGSSLIAFYLSSRLQLLVSKPLLFLTRKAKEISINKDYSIRIKKYTNDEVGGLITSFNEMLEEIEKQNQTVEKQLKVITQSNKQITDSINYAKRIQQAILPDLSKFNTYFPDSFVYYKPKDIVSGDFYWYDNKNGFIWVAAVDCTGHGVPGAFMSLISSNVLNRIVNQLGSIYHTDEVLNRLHAGIKKALKQNQKKSETQDGMDIALCRIDLTNLEIEYAGANRPLLYFKDGELQEIGGDKFPIGGNQYETDIIFSRHALQLAKGDVIYLCSDGYTDQFGGEKDKKFGAQRFRSILKKCADTPMLNIETELDTAFKEWKDQREQTDDILVIGIRL